MARAEFTFGPRFARTRGRATQAGVGLIRGAGAPRLGGPVKPGHDTLGAGAMLARVRGP